MRSVKYITLKSFLNTYKIDQINLVERGLFNKRDVDELNKIESYLNNSGILSSLAEYFRFSVRHPRFIKKFIFPQIKKRITGTEGKPYSWEESNVVKTNNLKATIATAFNPKTILEIGTYLGVGAATFKYIFPKCKVFTICPKLNSEANNPIESKLIGFFTKKKKLKVIQIWGDSMNYNFSKMKDVDFTYIDGNHKFEYVYSDLKKTSEITRKCILIDDYIPESEAHKEGLVYGPWNNGVVNATDLFLKENPGLFEQAIWIRGTKFCILIK